MHTHKELRLRVEGEHTVERRRYQRIATKLRCALVGTSPVVERWIGVTENISRQGLLIRWPRGGPPEAVVRVGCPVWVEVEWPMDDRSEKTYLRCQGRVIRVSTDPETGATLVAVSVRRAGLHRGSGREPMAGESHFDEARWPPSTPASA